MTKRLTDKATIIERLKEMGLSGEQQEQSQSEMFKNLQKRYSVAQLFHKVFSSVEGAQVLDHLMNQTYNKVAWNKDLPAEQCMTQGLHRDGQNSIMYLILSYMAIAENPPPVEPKVKTQDPLN